MGNSWLLLFAATAIASFIILKQREKMKHHDRKEKREEIRVSAGSAHIDIPLDFKPVEVSAGFVTMEHNCRGLPTCSPELGDSVMAEIVSYAGGRYWAVRVKWKVAGTRDIEIFIKNYAT